MSTTTETLGGSFVATDTEIRITLPVGLPAEEHARLRAAMDAYWQAGLQRRVWPGAPMCPQWCATSDQHEAEALDPRTEYYIHASGNLANVISPASGPDIDIEATILQVFDRSAPHEPWHAYVEVQGIQGEQQPAVARELASALLKAAEMIEAARR